MKAPKSVPFLSPIMHSCCCVAETSDVSTRRLLSGNQALLRISEKFSEPIPFCMLPLSPKIENPVFLRFGILFKLSAPRFRWGGDLVQYPVRLDLRASATGETPNEKPDEQNTNSGRLLLLLLKVLRQLPLAVETCC